jgi:polyhydroxyalkanoate synthesis regulator phasin
MTTKEEEMLSTRQTVLRILSEQPDRRMKLVRLARQMQTEGVLGFGVETEDVVDSLRKEGKVSYDSATDSVVLLSLEESKRFFMELERRSCLAAASELCRNDGYMSTDISEIVDKLRNKAEEIKNKLNE